MFSGRAVLFAFVSALLLVVGATSCKKNHAPDVPAVPAGPTHCFKDTTHTFTTTATDPDDDSVAVRFDWGDATVSDWSGWSASGETIALSHAWHNTGTYEVTVQARDRKELKSGWSGALTVTTVLRRLPYCPAEPTGPNRGSQDWSYSFTAVAFHPDSIAVAIRFAWGDGDTSDWSYFFVSGQPVKMSHVWSAPDTYEVTAQARDRSNAFSQWSAPHTITIRPPDTLLKWRLQLAAGVGLDVYSSPAIGPDGTVYVGSPDGALYAVNADGVLKWSYESGRDVESSPAIAADGTIYVGSDDDYLYAINSDGVLEWSYESGRDVESSPAIAADGTVYFSSRDGYLYALNPDGTLRWRYGTGSRVESSPAIAADGTVYVGSSDRYLYALDPGGTLRWRYETRSRVESSPAIAADGTVYVGSCDDYLYALNPDGTLRWRYETVRNVESSPAIAADGSIYLGSDDNFLYTLNPDGTLKWRFETDGDIKSSPTIGPDGTIYFAGCDGYLYALKGTSPLADSPWPKFHHDLRNTGRVGGGR